MTDNITFFFACLFFLDVDNESAKPESWKVE